MAKIDRVEDLPEWFDIENYRGAESFGAVEWYQHLALRSYLLTLLEIWHGDWRKEQCETAAGAFKKYIVHVRGGAIEQADIPTSIAVTAEDLIDEKNGISSLTFSDLYNHAANKTFLAHSKWLDPVHWFADMGKPLCSESEGEKVADSPLFLTGRPGYWIEQYATARVDLDYPDAILIERFASWLKEIRDIKGQQQAKRYHRPNFQRWARYGVLPYLDLTIWAAETGAHIPDRVMAAAVLPRLDFGESNLRKTIIPLAESLMSDLTELRALAACESADRAPADPETFEG